MRPGYSKLLAFSWHPIPRNFQKNLLSHMEHMEHMDFQLCKRNKLNIINSSGFTLKIVNACSIIWHSFILMHCIFISSTLHNLITYLLLLYKPYQPFYKIRIMVCDSSSLFSGRFQNNTLPFYNYRKFSVYHQFEDLSSHNTYILI